MSNTFLTSTAIAREAIMALQNNLVFANLVHRDFENEYKSQGDSVAVRVPATFTAGTFSSTATAQNITESSVIVTLDTIKTVDVEVTSKQMTLNIEDFASQVVQPAVYAIANAIDADIAALTKQIGYVTGSTGVSASALSYIAGCAKSLNNRAVPLDQRRLVINPDAHASLITLDAIVNAEKSGTTDALREASMGKLLGFDTYMNQNIVAQATANATIGDPLFIATALSGATTLTLVASALTATFRAGDRLVSTALTQGHVITTTVTTVTGTNTVNVTIAPALEKDVATGTVFTVVGAHKQNVAFHRDALALVSRPLALPVGGADGAVINYGGLSMRVTRGYTMAQKVNIVSFDILYGVKILDVKKAVVLYG
jgi:hypothetical protein